MNIHKEFCKRAVVLLLVLFVSACQTAPKNIGGGLKKFEPSGFADQYQKRSDDSSWKLKGAFSFANEDENVQGKVFWNQTDSQTQIKLLGPLGAGSVKLNIEPHVASMQQGQKTYTAESADDLMLKVLGWRMPLQSLSYWMYGLAAPDQKARYRSGEKGELIELQQSGWLIRFKQYREIEGFSLLMPRKIFASHVKTGTDVRLVVTKISR